MAVDNQRAARGQAYNLAVQTALFAGKGDDNEYITKQFLRHLQFMSLLQKADVHQLDSVLKEPKILKLIKDLDNAINEAE